MSTEELDNRELFSSESIMADQLGKVDSMLLLPLNHVKEMVEDPLVRESHQITPQPWFATHPKSDDSNWKWHVQTNGSTKKTQLGMNGCTGS